MNKKDPVGAILLITLFILLAIAGYISYKNIDWDVLERMENATLILPTPIISPNQPTTPVSSPSATP